MNRILPAIAVALTLALTGCGKSNKQGPSGPGATTQAAAAAPPVPFVQKGVPEGKVVVGYVQDNADPMKCSAVVDLPAGKEVFARAGDDYAKIVKGKVVPSCPTDNVVGECDNGMGLVTNYSGPKWTVEGAKKNCLRKPAHKWLE
jgi:hypothetical protein